MPRLFLMRKGSMVFGLALILFTTAGAWLDNQYKQQVLDFQQKSLQINNLIIDNINDVRVKIQSKHPYPSINILYADQDFATIEYNQHTYEIKTQIEQGVAIMDVTALSGDFAENSVRCNLCITLPLRVRSLNTEGFGAVTLISHTELVHELSLSGCSRTNIEMNVQRLTVNRPTDCAERTFIDATSRIDTLMAHASRGGLSIAPGAEIQSLQLMLAGEVTVDAPADMLRRAQWRVFHADPLRP